LKKLFIFREITYQSLPKRGVSILTGEPLLELVWRLMETQGGTNQ